MPALPGALKGMNRLLRLLAAPGLLSGTLVMAAELPPPFPSDSDQLLERTCFQTSHAWNEAGNLRSDVAIVYGIDPGLPERIQT